MITEIDKKLVQSYLASTQHIDWQTPAVLAKAQSLARGTENLEQIAAKTFEFVRDEILHSWDHKRDPVTCKASDVLRYGTGYCYAKSHLLAALLRANGIPSGLCYQRLRLRNHQQAFCLHGLNAVYLECYGWYRVDARGNKEGVSADFCPPTERLAYAVTEVGEGHFPQIWAEPIPEVLEVLLTQNSYQAVAEHLPDISLP